MRKRAEGVEHEERNSGKKVIGSSIGMPVGEALRKSHDIYLNQLMALEDAQEGLRALLEKRKPSWKNK